MASEEIRVRVRYPNGKVLEGSLGEANVSSLDEYIVYFDDCDSIPISWMTGFRINGEWHTREEVFSKRLLVPDNYNTCLQVPHSEFERVQGYNY